jgi:hypothetical protein
MASEYVSATKHQITRNRAIVHTPSWYDDMACASTFEVTLSTAPCRVCDTIDMVLLLIGGYKYSR